MGTFRSLCILGAGMVIGGAALIAHRISQETGKPFEEALSEVPGELQRLWSDMKGRAEEAIDHARQTYEESQGAFAQQPEGDASVE